MAISDEATGRIDALIQVAMRLAGSVPSGRTALARMAGQLEPEWVPRPWGDQIWAELQAARAAAMSEPVAPRDVERLLAEAWGAPLTEELDSFDPEPVALTPTSQVHRGVLDGVDVAIKVLRPGLAGLVRQDLALLEGLLGPLGAAFPAVDPQATLREVRERVLDELDLEHEAGSQRRFQRALRTHPGLVVPAPITRLAGESVLVSEWVDGVPLAEANDPDAAAARLVIFVAGGLRAGIVHADLDLEDVRVLADGRVAVLDYGAVRPVDPARADLALALVDGFAAGDGTAVGAALDGLGMLSAEYGPQVLELASHVLGPLGEADPVRLDSAAVVAAGRRLARRPDALELIMAGALPPEDLWPMRGLGQLFGTIARVGATGPWRSLLIDALRNGWNA